MFNVQRPTERVSLLTVVAAFRPTTFVENPVLKVKGDSKPNSVAGAICNIVRESSSGQPPSVVATGPAAINQAMKAIAIARKYLLDEDSPTDMVVYPRFEEDIRQSSRVCFELKKSRNVMGVVPPSPPPPGGGVWC